MKVLGVILAGGQSRRMGGPNKVLMALGGQPLIQHVALRLAEQVDDLIINANEDPAALNALGYPVIGDAIAGFAGPLAGLHAGMIYARAHGFSHVLTVAADTPFFPADLQARLVAQGQDMQICLAATAMPAGPRLHPTFGLWDVALCDDLETQLHNDMRKVLAWVERFAWRDVTWPMGDFDPFFNINTPDDMDQGERILKGQAH